MQEGTNNHRSPAGWRWVRLGEVCEITAGQSPPGNTYRKVPEGLPFFQGKGDFGLRCPVAQCWCVAPKKIALPGDILISVRAPVGPTNVADVECCIGRGLSAIRPRAETDRDFVLAALKLFEGKLEKLGSGSTFGAIKRDDLESIEIPFPPLEEQKRIAAILNDQMEVVERARAAAQAQLEAAKGLPAAYLRAVFSSPEAQHWLRGPLGALLVEPLKTGISKPTLAGANKFCLTLSAVRNGLLDLTAKKPVDVTDSEAEGNWVRGGAFYVVRGNGNRSLVGRGALAPSSITTPVLYPDLLIQVTTNPVLVAPEYLRLAWDNEETRVDIERRSRTSAGIYKINQANLASVTIPLPPLTEQQRIAAMLNEQMASAQRARKAIEEELDAINKLPSALLRRAFNGEL